MLHYTFLTDGLAKSLVKKLGLSLVTGALLAAIFFVVDEIIGFLLTPALLFYPLIGLLGAGLAYWYFFLTLNEEKEAKVIWLKSYCLAFMGMGFARLLRLSDLGWMIGGASLFLGLVCYALYYWWSKPAH